MIDSIAKPPISFLYCTFCFIKNLVVLPYYMYRGNQKIIIIKEKLRWTASMTHVYYMAHRNTSLWLVSCIILIFNMFLYNTIHIKLRWALFVTYTSIQSIMRSEISSLHLTHPSAHMPGAVVSWHCSARGAVGGSVPCLRVSPQSWTLPAIRTHNIGLPWDSSPTLYPLGHRYR